MSLLNWFGKKLSRKQTFYYARLNNKLVCTSVWSFDIPLEKNNFIVLDSFDQTIIGKLWNGRSWTTPCS